MNLDRRYLVWSLCYAVAGMTLGIYMAASAEPILSVSSIGVLVGMLLMLYMVVRSRAADGGG